MMAGLYGRYIFSLKKTAKLFSGVAVPFHTPTNKACETQFLPILPRTWYYHNFLPFQLLFNEKRIQLICVSLLAKDVELLIMSWPSSPTMGKYPFLFSLQIIIRFTYFYY